MGIAVYGKHTEAATAKAVYSVALARLTAELKAAKTTRERLASQLYEAEKRAQKVDEMHRQVVQLTEKLADFQRAALHYIREADRWKAKALGVVFEEPFEMDKTPVETIVKEVLEDYPGIAIDDILSARRNPDLVRARQHCFHAVYSRRKDMSYPAIGKWFNRDHTTILHGVKRHGERIESEG